MSIDTSKGHPEMDYDEHTKTYDDFIKLTKYSTVAIIALLVLMAVFVV